MAMDTIIITGLDGPAINGTKWDIHEGQQGLERVDTKQQAINRARNKWAAPGQRIKLVNTKGKVSILREGDPSKQPDQLSTGSGKRSGGLLSGLDGLDDLF